MVRNELIKDENGGSTVVIKCAPDLILSILVVILVCLGSVMLYSAGSAYYEDDSLYFLKQHAKHLLIGLIFFSVPFFALTPKLGKIGSILLYGLTIPLLGAVLIFGKTAGGAQRWLDFGIIQFQPSELAKTAIVLILANYFSRKKEIIALRKKNVWNSILYGIIIPLGIIAVPCVLVAFEHHLSATAIIFAIGGIMMFLGGTNILELLVLGGGGAVILNSVGWRIKYTRERIEGLLNRGSDPENDWQTTEGLYAMGNGGFFGVGLGNSSLKYGYVSQPQNDFIFAVICEELGFFGAMVIILLFFAMFARGIRLAQKCSDRFCSLVIAGLSFKFIIHVLLNIAVVAAVIPNTGISLPFFSSGGSATLVQLLDAGIMLGMSRYCHD